jgi:hypothetical protein
MIRSRMIDMFATMFSQRDIVRWIQDKGEQNPVLDSDDNRGNTIKHVTHFLP